HCGGIRPRADLSVGQRAPTRLSPATGDRTQSGVSRDSRREYLRRSVALDAPEDGAVHRALVPEHDETAAVAALPADDARSGDDPSLVSGPWDAATPSPCAR